MLFINYSSGGITEPRQNESSEEAKRIGYLGFPEALRRFFEPSSLGFGLY